MEVIHMEVQIVHLGLMDYKKVYDLQKMALGLRQKNLISDTLLLVEHDSVITSGIRGARDHILVTNHFLKDMHVPVYEIRRGGDVTYHGPGQIVGYPIIDLKNHGKNIRSFVRSIEEIFIRLLNDHYNIVANRDSLHPGVWVEDNKITAVGFEIKRWVSMHGFAFNVNTKMYEFDWIIPCGIKEKGVTSLQQIIGRAEDENQIREWIIHYFSEIFKVKTHNMDKQEFLASIEKLLLDNM
ncbi:lipoyl(octanoyl) transferase LipB [Petrocella sp. FN5]|uniref:lipoyl(octanoyl) transferase LipB n=1 Tax=Petrocella sp. FN5 TaxID=3032002 RepID=UPI0023DB0D27|nr:lipoyl(octanoyl) transferase LipB [Petrocella sp. FN5]MDF1616900.1 lipoyl(octanoyl) transferase LipB [Petrocella sp. FN5]